MESVASAQGFETNDSTLHSVADAMRDASAAAAGHAAKVKQMISDAGPRAMQSVSRASYSSAYVCAYGIVYAAVFVANALPKENPIMKGFSDGGRAAMDALKAD